MRPLYNTALSLLAITTVSCQVPTDSLYNIQSMYNLLAKFNYSVSSVSLSRPGYYIQGGVDSTVPIYIPQGVLTSIVPAVGADASGNFFHSSILGQSYNVQSITFPNTDINNNTSPATGLVAIAEFVYNTTVIATNIESASRNVLMIFDAFSGVDIINTQIDDYCNMYFIMGGLNTFGGGTVVLQNLNLGQSSKVAFTGPGTVLINGISGTAGVIDVAGNVNLAGDWGNSIINILPIYGLSTAATVPANKQLTVSSIQDTNGDLAPTINVQGFLALTSASSTVIHNIQSGGHLQLLNKAGTFNGGPIILTGAVLQVLTNGTSTSTSTLRCDSNSVIQYYVPILYVGQQGTVINYNAQYDASIYTCNVVIIDNAGNYAQLYNPNNAASKQYTGGYAAFTTNNLSYQVTNVTSATASNSTTSTSKTIISSAAYTSSYLLRTLALAATSLLYTLF